MKIRETEEWKSEVVCPKVTQQDAGREQRTEPSLLTLDSLPHSEFFPNSCCLWITVLLVCNSTSCLNLRHVSYLHMDAYIDSKTLS